MSHIGVELAVLLCVGDAPRSVAAIGSEGCP